MKAITRLLSCCSVALLVSSCASNLAETTKPASKPSSNERAVAERIFSMINADRAQSGMKPLRGNSGLNRLAQKQADFMSRGATNGQASTMGSNNRAQYASLRLNIENVTELANSTSSGNAASAIVQSWKGSPEHNRTLRQTWNTTGIGVSVGRDGKTYVTMLLGVSGTGVPRSVTPIGW
ncbi:hypothetical protein NT6N_02640 [Oceaniferula spumae]|uniref:SCP domain-containing protein n=1 Tax=Oceaniferula spumae TaxID=2979115 RepID=A0AAT9FH42_9BACT